MFINKPSIVTYVVAGGSTVFPFEFKFYADSDIVVFRTPSGQVADNDNDRLAVIDYEIISNASRIGGDVTVTIALTDGDIITIQRALPITRTVEYTKRGNFTAVTVNDDNDYQTYLILDQFALTETYLKVPVGNVGSGVDFTFPSPEASKIIGWTPSGTALENKTIGANDTIVNILNVNNIAELLLVDPLFYSTVNVRGYFNANDGGSALFNYIGGTWIRQYKENMSALMLGADSNLIMDSDSMVGTPAIGDSIIFDGFYTSEDGLGGRFVYTAEAHDGVAVFYGWRRQFIGMFNVKWSGAKGDGVTDDLTLLQAVLDSGYKSIYFPRGTYMVSDTLIANVSGTSLSAYPSKSSPYNNAEIKFTSGQLNKPVLKCTYVDTNFTMSYIKINGDSFSPSSGVVCIELNGSDDSIPDRDVEFHRCAFLNANTHINMYGRGLKVVDSVFFQSYTPIKLNWKTTYIDQGGAQTTVENGYRAFQVTNNRFHGCPGYIFDTIGHNEENCQGILFNDNYIDTNLGILTGSIKHSTFTGNVFLQTANSPIFFLKDAYNLTISGNMFSTLSNVGSTSSFFITNIINTATTFHVEAITFTGNTIAGCYHDGFFFRSTWKDIIITGNSFNDMLRGNDDSGLTDVYAIVRFSSAGVGSGLVFQSNTVDTGAYARNDQMVRTEVSAPNIQDWVVQDNVYDTALLTEHNLDLLYTLGSKDEYGTDGTDNYIKKANGELICYGERTNASVSVTIAQSAIGFRGDAIPNNFPHSFIASPSVKMSQSGINGASGGSQPATTTAFNAYPIAVASGTYSFDYSYVAHGRWKA